MKAYTLFIPVLNEESILRNNTEKLISYMDSLQVSYEIIIVSNGSIDNTNKYGYELEKQFPQLRFYVIPKKGVGRAIKVGIKHARYENFISLDMDLSIDMDYIKKAIYYLNSYDIVVGSKKMGTQKRSILRTIPSIVFTLLTKTMLKLSYGDYSIAAKAYKTQILRKYIKEIDQGSSYVINILFFSKKKHARLIEIPVSCFDTRKSRFNIINESIYRAKKLSYLFFNRNKY